MIATTAAAAPVVTTAPPLRLVLVASPDRRVPARAVALGSGADVVLEVTLGHAHPFVELASDLRGARPDVVLVSAGSGETQGVADALEALAVACEGARMPAVLLAVDERMARRLLPATRGAGERIVDVARGRDDAVARLRALRSGGPARPGRVEAQARAHARVQAQTTLTVDVGEDGTSLVLVSPGGALTSLHTALGCGPSVDALVAGGGLDRVRRWIPRAIDAPALLDRVFSRARWPEARPATTLTLAIELALLREAIARLIALAERAGIDVAPLRAAPGVVAGGALARLAPSQTVLVLLDALGPDATTLVSRSVDATIEPLALVTVPAVGRGASVRVADANGVTDERVTRGALFVVRTSGAPRVSVGGEERSVASSLAVGVVVDARGRPLELPPRDAERLPAVARWHAALDALPSEPAS